MEGELRVIRDSFFKAFLKVLNTAVLACNDAKCIGAMGCDEYEQRTDYYSGME
jgi:hypothetical protein